MTYSTYSIQIAKIRYCMYKYLHIDVHNRIFTEGHPAECLQPGFYYSKPGKLNDFLILIMTENEARQNNINIFCYSVLNVIFDFAVFQYCI
jgi:hypothetical protein